jgi:heme-degrading monooxygenase HmoA
MYAQLVMLTIGPGMRSTGEKLAEQFEPVLKSLRGFKGVTFFGNVEVGEYGSLSIWESKEDAEAAAAAMGPRLEQAVSGVVKEQPTRRFFEVYESKA